MGTPATAKRNKSAASTPFWQRLTPLQRALIVMALAAAVVLPRIDKVTEPFARGFALSSQIVRSEHELKMLEEQHSSLTAQMQELKTAEGLKLEIRESLGHLEPGEYLLHVVVQPPTEAPPPKPVPFMKAQGLDVDSAALAIRDTMTDATEVFLKWANVGRSEGARTD